MALLSSKERGNLADSDFAHVEPGHAENGKTPDKFRHFPIHDAAHVRNALARIAQGARFGDQAKPKVLAAAKKFGIEHDSSADTGRSLESLTPELRFVYASPEFEVRSVDGVDHPHITGYAAMFGKRSRRLGGFHEVVNPTAFSQAEAGGYEGVVCRYNHKDDMVLGTTRGGTLEMRADDKGLFYDVNPPRHRADVMELVQRRDVQYSSFAFRCNVPGQDDEWTATSEGIPLRTLHNVELVDVAPVLDPAYFDTSATSRSMTGAVESLARWVDADPTEVRSMLEAGQASRFFRRSDRSSTPPAPRVPEVSADAAEARMVDDPCIASRNWNYNLSEATVVPVLATEEDEVREDPHGDAGDEELRALRNHDDLCKQWTSGQPCAKAMGHDGDHAPLCWRSQDGFPCAKVQDHGGEHEPIHVEDGKPARGRPPVNRDASEVADETAEEQRTLDANAAFLKLSELRSRMVRDLDDVVAVEAEDDTEDAPESE